jgi:ABC-type lipoprotein export system ATPase subunit
VRSSPSNTNRTGHLSAGEAQRVAHLLALLASQGLLLLDEPVTALPPELARRAVDLIASLTKEQGWTAIVVSHQPLEGLQPTAHLELAEGLLRTL